MENKIMCTLFVLFFIICTNSFFSANEDEKVFCYLTFIYKNGKLEETINIKELKSKYPEILIGKIENSDAVVLKFDRNADTKEIINYITGSIHFMLEEICFNFDCYVSSQISSKFKVTKGIIDESKKRQNKLKIIGFGLGFSAANENERKIITQNLLVNIESNLRLTELFSDKLHCIFIDKFNDKDSASLFLRNLKNEKTINEKILEDVEILGEVMPDGRIVEIEISLELKLRPSSIFVTCEYEPNTKVTKLFREYIDYQASYFQKEPKSINIFKLNFDENSRVVFGNQLNLIVDIFLKNLVFDFELKFSEIPNPSLPKPKDGRNLSLKPESLFKIYIGMYYVKMFAEESNKIQEDIDFIKKMKGDDLEIILIDSDLTFVLTIEGFSAKQDAEAFLTEINAGNKFPYARVHDKGTGYSGKRILK